MAPPIVEEPMSYGQPTGLWGRVKALMANPIIQRELVGQLRLTSALAIQVSLVAALGLLVVLRWPTEGQVDVSGVQAQQVLQLFGYGMLAVWMLLTPAFPATAIIGEKQQQTLALLLTSPMGRWSILFGKLFGAIGFMLLLMVLSMPAATACYTMGGVAPIDLLYIYGILICLSLQYATLGLLASTYAGTTESALRLTYGMALTLAVVTLGPDQFMRGFIGPQGAVAISWIRSISPIPAMMEAVGQGGLLNRGLQDTINEPLRYMAIALGSSVVFTLMIAQRLSMKLYDKSRSRGTITDERSTKARVFRRIMYLWGFDPKRRSRPIGPWINPIMIKEMRSRRFGRSHWMMRLFAVCLMLSMGLAIVTVTSSQNLSVAQLGRIVVLIQFAIIVLLTPPLAAALISSERESGGLPLIVMTGISAPKIIIGKLLSVLFTLAFVLLATTPCYLVMTKIDVGGTLRIADCLFSLVLSTFLALLVSAAIGSLFRNSAAAAVTACGVLIALCGGTMLVWMLRDAPFSHATVEAVLRFNPLAATLSLVDAPGLTEYDLVPVNWYYSAVGCVLGAAVLIVQTYRLTRPQ